MCTSCEHSVSLQCEKRKLNSQTQLANSRGVMSSVVSPLSTMKSKGPLPPNVQLDDDVLPGTAPGWGAALGGAPAQPLRTGARRWEATRGRQIPCC